MSRENVEIARRAYEAYNRGDLEGMVVDFAPKFEYETTGAVPGTRAVYRGPNGWREFAGWMREEFYDARIEIHELIEAGGTARLYTDRHLRDATKPSKPPGCRSSDTFCPVGRTRAACSRQSGILSG